MIIEIKGVQFINKGAELMLLAILQQLERRLPDTLIALEPNPNSNYSDRVKIGALQKLSLRAKMLDVNYLSYLIPSKLRRWLRDTWGIITEADIDIILDASGFAYGDQWSPKNIQQLQREINRFHKKNKKYLFLPQAFGPFTRSRDIKRLRDCLPKAALICSREETSYKHLSDLLTDDRNLSQYPDFTNLLQGTPPDTFNKDDKIVSIITNNNMVSNRNTNSTWKRQYLKTIRDAIEIIYALNLTPIFLNHEGTGDLTLCSAVIKDIGRDIKIINESNPLRVKGIIKNSRAVISSRFHGCVSALSQGTPCLGTSWSHKYERLFDDYQCAQNIITPETNKKQLKEMLIAAIRNCDSIKNQKARTLQLKQAEEMWDTVEQIIRSN